MQSTGVKANILELCRCSEQRSDGWWETNYGRVIWTNRIWASALRSTPVRTEWWSVQRPDDTSPCRQTRASNNTITQMLLILYPSVILHFHHSSCSASPSLVLSLPFLLSLTLLVVLPLTPVAVELLMGCWASEISPAANLFVGLGLCCFLFLLSHCVCVWMCVCVRGCKYAFVFG